MRPRSGFTLPELLIAMTVALALVGGGYFMLNMATDVYKRISGHEDGALQMKKAARRIQVDLQASNPTLTSVDVSPGTVGNDGDAVWMLSTASGDEASGNTNVTETGAPYWQRNVLYYPARPNGDTCAGITDADGYEDGCPHKTILRKVMDSPPATVPLASGGNPAADKEELLPGIAVYLTRPTGFGTAGMMGEPRITHAEIIAVNILTMRVEKDPDPNAPGELKVTFQTFNEDAGRRTTAIGSTNLGNHAKTLTHVVSVFPRNKI